MAGRKKVTEETMAAKERMETEVQATEGAETLPDGDAVAEGTDMDLNELLESMDQEPKEPGGQEGEGMPELSEEEIFGEAASETDGTDTEEVEVVSGTDSEVEAGDEGTEKPKRRSALPAGRKLKIRLQREVPGWICPQRAEKARHLRIYRKGCWQRLQKVWRQAAEQRLGKQPVRQSRTARRKIRQKRLTFLKSRPLRQLPAERPGQEIQRRPC